MREPDLQLEANYTIALDELSRLRHLNAEMLEVLQNFSNWAMPSDAWSPEYLRSVDRLIAKAEGVK